MGRKSHHLSPNPANFSVLFVTATHHVLLTLNLTTARRPSSEVQAYLSLVAGALLSYNVVLPSDEPNIARLMGMWSVWMFTVPSLRARECDAKEKDALNFLFIAIPLINVLIPVVWKSFAAVFTADCLLMAYMYYNKGAGIFDDGAEAPPKADDAA